MAENSIDLSSAKEVRLRTAVVRNSQEQFGRDLDAVLGLPEGRRLIWHLCQGDALNDSGALTDAFVAGQSDLTSYRLGRQSIARALLAEVMKPERFKTYAMIVKEVEMIERVKDNG